MFRITQSTPTSPEEEIRSVVCGDTNSVSPVLKDRTKVLNHNYKRDVPFWEPCRHMLHFFTPLQFWALCTAGRELFVSQ